MTAVMGNVKNFLATCLLLGTGYRISNMSGSGACPLPKSLLMQMHTVSEFVGCY